MKQIHKAQIHKGKRHRRSAGGRNPAAPVPGR